MSRKWTAGDEYRAGTLNEIVDELQAMLRPAEVWLEQRTTPTTITADADDTPFPTFAITWDTAVVDTESGWSGDTYTVSRPGWYEVEYGASWSSLTSAAENVTVELQVNGADGGSAWYDDAELDRYDSRNIGVASASIPVLKKTYQGYFAEGDEVRVRVSSYLGRETHPTQPPMLRMRWVHP